MQRQNVQAVDLFLQDCLGFDSKLDAKRLRLIATTAVRYYQADDKGRQQIRYNQKLERRWYDSLDNGVPDYGVYDGIDYLCDLFACWLVYSRKYIRMIASPKSLPPLGVTGDLGEVRSVVDLGCGIGYTTGALLQLFPGSHVVGTNLEGTVQISFARMKGRHQGFRVVSTVDEVSPPVDLVFASEYFEHFQEPVEHLRAVVNALQPRSFLIANAFGTTSLGHFRDYNVGGVLVSGNATSVLFNKALVRFGYRKIKTSLWNNRPAYWKRTARMSSRFDL